MDLIESLGDITTFVQVIEIGGFRGVGKQLGISKPLVSKRFTRLEKQLGIQLLHRSTRLLTLTESGRHCFEQVKSIPLQIETARESTRPLCDGTEGHLKLIVPVGFGMSMMKKLLPQFMRDFPDIDIQMKSVEHPLRHVNEGFDIIVSGKRPYETFPDPNLIAKHLLDLPAGLYASPAGLYASPAYLEKYGTPESPEDLKQHKCICYTEDHQWPFLDADGNLYLRHITPHFRGNNSLLLANVALCDQGICYGFDFMFDREDFIQGRIVKILQQHIPKVTMNRYLFYLKTDYLPAKTRELIRRMLEAYRPRHT